VGDQFHSDQASINVGADKVKGVRADVTADLDRLRTIVTDLTNEGWKGSAAAGFGVVMNSWDGSVKKLLVAMDEIEKLMRKSGMTFTQRDQEAHKDIMSTDRYSSALGAP
jgi:WXG100 family type VII secretion target